QTSSMLARVLSGYGVVARYVERKTQLLQGHERVDVVLGRAPGRVAEVLEKPGERRANDIGMVDGYVAKAAHDVQGRDAVRTPVEVEDPKCPRRVVGRERRSNRLLRESRQDSCIDRRPRHDELLDLGGRAAD